ncbi:MAG: hypothetical protein IKH51_00005, partial [Clostridia bacterium]|nr:hypothetical protein [Clostridia bacterium]
MIKYCGKRITSLLLCVLLLFSALATVSYAVTDQDMAQISVTVKEREAAKMPYYKLLKGTGANKGKLLGLYSDTPNAQIFYLADD